jgi:hypothetical protein
LPGAVMFLNQAESKHKQYKKYKPASYNRAYTFLNQLFRSFPAHKKQAEHD